jgi:hypothetical protein
MKLSNQAVLTENSIVVLSRGVFQTSIPLRHWSTHDGVLWSGLLRQGHQIEWLIANLNESLNEPTNEFLMQRVIRVLSDSKMPPRLPPRSKKTVENTTECDENKAASPPSIAPIRRRSVPRRRSPPTTATGSFVATGVTIVA